MLVIQASRPHARVYTSGCAHDLEPHMNSFAETASKQLTRKQFTESDRHTLFCYTLLYCALQKTCFSQIKGLWQPCIKRVYQNQFSSSICSLCVPASHLGNSQCFKIFQYMILFVTVSVISGLCCCYYNCFREPITVAM